MGFNSAFKGIIEVGTMKETFSITGLTPSLSSVTYYRQNILEIG